jgi:hypothetical protein
MWLTECNVYLGILIFRFMSFSDWSVVIRLTQITNDNEFERLVIRAGDE